MTQDKIYINACGMVNALGDSHGRILHNLLAGDVAGMVPWDIKVYDKTVLVGAVNTDLPIVPATLESFDCRNNRLMLAALTQIRDQLDALFRRYAPDRIAIILGSSTSGIREGEQALFYQQQHHALPSAYQYRQQEIGSPALFLQKYLGLRGLAYTISTACSSSAKVFASAKRLILSGVCDAAIVGGIDSLCRLTVNGFSSLESVSAGLCNPMSINRDGINIGEAASLFILSREADQIELAGVGESSDAHHMSAPDPSGAGAASAMQAALADARLPAGAIDYINMHGTATPLNDAMESLAIARIFGNDTPVSSTKPLIGHTLGAAGAAEVGFCWLILNQPYGESGLPPHRWDGQRDEKLPPIHLISPGEGLKIRPQTAFISNSFAFGGNNASVIIARQ